MLPDPAHLMDVVYKAACHHVAAARPYSALQVSQQLLVATTDHSNLAGRADATQQR